MGEIAAPMTGEITDTIREMIERRRQAGRLVIAALRHQNMDKNGTTTTEQQTTVGCETADTGRGMEREHKRIDTPRRKGTKVVKHEATLDRENEEEKNETRDETTPSRETEGAKDETRDETALNRENRSAKDETKGEGLMGNTRGQIRTAPAGTETSTTEIKSGTTAHVGEMRVHHHDDMQTGENLIDEADQPHGTGTASVATTPVKGETPTSLKTTGGDPSAENHPTHGTKTRDPEHQIGIEEDHPNAGFATIQGIEGIDMINHIRITAGINTTAQTEGQKNTETETCPQIRTTCFEG